MDEAVRTSDEDNERLQRIAERLLVFLYYQAPQFGPMDPGELWQCVNLWVEVSPLEIKQALAILQRAEFITCCRKFGRADGPANYWYVNTKGGPEAIRLSTERPSIFERPLAGGS